MLAYIDAYPGGLSLTHVELMWIRAPDTAVCGPSPVNCLLERCLREILASLEALRGLGRCTITTPGEAGTSRKEHGFDLVLGLRSGGVPIAKASRRSSSSTPKARAVEVRSLVIDQLKAGSALRASARLPITVAGCQDLCRSCGPERPRSLSGGGRGQWRRPRDCARWSGCRLRA